MLKLRGVLGCLASAAVLSSAGCTQSASEKKEDTASRARPSAAAAKPVAREAVAPGEGGVFSVLRPAAANAQEPGKDSSWTENAPVNVPAEVIGKMVTALEDRISRPGITIQIQNFRRSSAKGVLVGEAVLGARGQTITKPVYASEDGRWVTIGGMYKLDQVSKSEMPGFKILSFRALTPDEDEEEGGRELMVTDDGQFATFGVWTDTQSDPRAERMKMVTLEGASKQGAKNGKVVIVEFSDFQCPFCDRAAKTMRQEVYPAYKDKVTFYFKHLPLPFHKWADEASIASLCVQRDAGDEKFWKLYNYYFDNQKSLSEGNLKDKTYNFVKTLGINEQKFKKCFENRETQKQLDQDMAEASALGITGTPGFLVNGKKLSGAQPFSAFKAEIDAILASR
ncbi:MAG: DsbA family protein [Deltaproteobacteria bacterium]|nr:DsbA family protein [Deltaproteobacteria bacterium]